MRVTIAVKGRFHAFYLAEHLQRHGCLKRLITSYPVFEAGKYGVQRDRVRSVLTTEIIDRAWRKTPAFLRSRYDLHHLLAETFDAQVCRRIPSDTDIFVGWSSFSLRSLRAAKHLGATTIIERSSTHMLHQCEVLREEYGRCGLEPRVAPPKAVEKELAEYEETDFISVPSRYVKQTFLERGFPEKKLVQVPFGVDLRWFKPLPKEDDCFRVIHCGTLSVRKGVHYLLQGFSELNLPGAELWLIGPVTGEMQPFLSRFASPSVSVKGAFPEFELHKLYSQGSVFCLASVEEGLAMVQLQAMACGLPVICTTKTGGEDVVRDGTDGFVIPPQDVEKIKEKILYFYEHRDACEEMGRSARRRVESGFTWDHYGSRMVSQYRSALGERRGALSGGPDVCG